MVKITDKIHAYVAQSHAHPYFSYEYFPPKTEAGLENLYERIDRMTHLEPLFIDVTWGAGGSTEQLSMAICEYSQKFFGVDALMHLTCTQLSTEAIIRILQNAKDAGIQNILALRGDPPKGAFSWNPVSNGLNHAIDLVKLIRQHFGDYFCIGVAGFPEGHPQSPDNAEYISHIKAKLDAGADFILTQFFYDIDVFLDFVTRCRAAGIKCPILPGMMPIQSYSTFQKMITYCRTRVPQAIWDELTPIREDDEEVKAFGVRLCVQMCRKLMQAGIRGFHFYTLNLEKSVLSILRELGVDSSVSSRRALPWRGSRSNLKGISEDVRPINWANRPKSYIKRTVTWDEYPNGRWGDNRSPAFGELSDLHFFRHLGTKEDRLAMWGESPLYVEDIYEIFALYVEGKIPSLPWCESSLQLETKTISSTLAGINRKGFLTINSQPAVNGERSDHPVFGWGGLGGRVYQKAYLEFFTSPRHLQALLAVCSRYPQLSLHAVDYSGNILLSSATKGVTAVTWGVFPNKEILQPTVFDHDTFLVWSQEAFQCWLTAWASLYDDETDSSALLYEIHDTFYLVAILDNDYVEGDLFSVFDEVERVLQMELMERSQEDLGGSIGMDV